MRVAVYPGSFDPLTNGHLDIIRRGTRLFDRVLVAVLENEEKSALFSVAERMALIQSCTSDVSGVEVHSFTGLLVDFASSIGSKLLIRGLRAVSDFEYEYQMALMNRHLSPTIETVFMVPSLDTTYISASLVREIARYGGDLTSLVHPVVADALRKRPAGA